MRRVETATSQGVKSSLTNDPVTAPHAAIRDGAIAQLGERLHGMQEVSGSIPLGSTTIRNDEFYGRLVGEVSPTGFFRVSERFACLMHCQIGWGLSLTD